jgi:hypothetical protein
MIFLSTTIKQTCLAVGWHHGTPALRALLVHPAVPQAQALAVKAAPAPQVQALGAIFTAMATLVHPAQVQAQIPV